MRPPPIYNDDVKLFSSFAATSHRKVVFLPKGSKSLTDGGVGSGAGTGTGAGTGEAEGAGVGVGWADTDNEVGETPPFPFIFDDVGKKNEVVGGNC